MRGGNLPTVMTMLLFVDSNTHTHTHTYIYIYIYIYIYRPTETGQLKHNGMKQGRMNKNCNLTYLVILFDVCVDVVW